MSNQISTHSHFSLLSGVPSPEQLAEAAADAGYSALGLCDWQRLSGAIEFYDACRKRGVQPLLGLDLRLRRTSAEPVGLVLVAQNLRGWRNLCDVSSTLLSDPHQGEGMLATMQLLRSHDEGLLCLVGGPLFETAQLGALTQLKDLFKDRLYMRLLPEPGQTLTAQLAKRFGIPLVADWPVFYLNPEQAVQQRVVTAMRLNTTLEQLPLEAAAPPNAYFPQKQEFEAAFSAHPEALASTDEIAERCQLELPLGKPHFPTLDLPDDLEPDEALRQKAVWGARRLYCEIDASLTKRLEHELAGIQASGYTSLFLIMEEIISFARRADVPFSSRGSAASSLVAHCLGITTPDPVRLNLYFERFLNPARHSPPDVDTDLCSRRRDQVIEHVYEHYGADRVAMVATINRFRRRSALREVAKAHGLSPGQISALVKTIPGRFWGPPGLRSNGNQSPYRDLAQMHTNNRYQRIFRDAERLLGVPHHFSIHPGGVVISPGPMHQLVGTQQSSKGVAIIQYDLDGVERMGLVKIDLLGIRGLTVLGDVADQIRLRQPQLGRTRLDVLESIPADDPATAETIRSGATIGCFQIESLGMRGTIREVQSQTIDDVMVALALFRPGPLTGGLKDAFVRRHLGREKVSHLHPALEPLLAETHGVILYQEQVLRIAHELAGMSLAESDMLRRAMSHFDPGQKMQSLQKNFIAGAQEHSNIAPETGARIWDLMAAFAGYGFPKAHAASYALTAWRSAWCKTHYPAEFMAAVLANWGGYYAQSAYLMEARRMGLSLHAPHINYSHAQFSINYQDDEPHLYMGLDQLRDLTRETQKKIVHMRPFDSLADFLTRVFPRIGETRNLIEAGALEGLGTIPSLLNQMETGTWRKGQLPLFGIDMDTHEDWPADRKADAQEKLLGVSLISHPLEAYASLLAAIGALSTVDAGTKIDQPVSVAGISQQVRRTQSSRGTLLYFMDLGDLEGTLRVMIDEALYKHNKGVIAQRAPILVEGQIQLNRDGTETTLIAHSIRSLVAASESVLTSHAARPEEQPGQLRG
ncbi:MAG: DNA polymerase III subunit alpha [Chloroflexi bacterium]|nr:DNA polymerase III subunit alpha [Chloroflexota bacterium]